MERGNQLHVGERGDGRTHSMRRPFSALQGGEYAWCTYRLRIVRRHCGEDTGHERHPDSGALRREGPGNTTVPFVEGGSVLKKEKERARRGMRHLVRICGRYRVSRPLSACVPCRIESLTRSPTWRGPKEVTS